MSIAVPSFDALLAKGALKRGDILRTEIKAVRIADGERVTVTTRYVCASEAADYFFAEISLIELNKDGTFVRNQSPIKVVRVVNTDRLGSHNEMDVVGTVMTCIPFTENEESENVFLVQTMTETNAETHLLPITKEADFFIEEPLHFFRRRIADGEIHVFDLKTPKYSNVSFSMCVMAEKCRKGIVTCRGMGGTCKEQMEHRIRVTTRGAVHGLCGSCAMNAEAEGE